MNPVAQKTFVVLLTGIIHCTVAAQSVVPDLTFGVAGKISINYATDAPTFATCAAMASDGTITIGGNIIARLQPNGAPDLSFNGSGFYFNPQFNIAPRSIDVYNGAVLALYSDYNTDSAIIVKKLTHTGIPDNNFGDKGQSQVALPGHKLTGNKILVQPDGKIVIAGSAGTAVFISRLLPNGYPDTSFNHTGSIILPVQNGTAAAVSMVLQGSNNIFITGKYSPEDNSPSTLFCLKISTAGLPDAAFANAGFYIETSANNAAILPEAIALQPDGKIVIAATAGTQILVLRLGINGIADSSFNNTGRVYSFIGQNNKPADLHIRPGGKIIIAAETLIAPEDPSNWNYAAIQLLENGQHDIGFNGSGKMYQSVAGLDQCAAGLLQPDGRLVLAGFASEFSLITLVGVDTLGQTDFSFGLGGIRILQLLGTQENLVAALEHMDNKVLLAGAKSEGVLDKSNIVLVRLKADGTPDSSFGTNGKAGFLRNNTILRAAALQQDKSIVLCGSFFDENTSRFRTLLTRLTPGAAQDNSFAPLSNFTVLSEPVQNQLVATPLVIQPDDYIVTGQNLTNGRIAINRYAVHGDADVFFGNNGKREIFEPGKTYHFNSVALMPDGKIVTGAYEQLTDTSTGIALFRLMQWGPDDTDFNGTGTVKLPFIIYDNGQRNNIEILADEEGRLIVGATVTTPGDTGSYIVITRLNNNGSADNSFNETGTVTIPVEPGYKYVLSKLALHPDSSILIAGNGTTNGNTYPFLMRLTNDGKIDSTIDAGGTGVLWIEKSAGAAGKTLLVKEDSTVIAAGNMHHSSTGNDFAVSAYQLRALQVYRFTGNGNWTDIENWHGGLMPPAILPDSGYIFIQPRTGGTCILNTTQTLQQGSCLVLLSGKNLVVTGNLIIN
ncbi:MAG TPA: hypothetical protein PKC39_12700 [Ferruginibacter sp.]|nr:hypothetical protein [Ferruginibacter sp.]HMP21811.1 hypothetical protein [Ferruginibacter sp.]